MARDYQITRTLGTELAFRDTVAHILAQHADLKPRVDCQVATHAEESTHRLRSAEFNYYHLDGADYVGLLRHHKLRPDSAAYLADLRPKPCWITFDHPSHVYDIRRHMYRGFTDRIEDVIYPARAELYALMPYEIRALTVTARRLDQTIHAQGHVSAGPDPAALSTHVFHLELRDPSGRLRPEYTANILAPAGRFQTDIFLGLHPDPGPWRITTRELISGFQRTITIDF